MSYRVDTSLAIRLGLARKKRSQSWLSRETGMSRPHICNLCSDENKSRPSIDCLESIAEALEIPVSILIKEGEE